LHKNPQSTDWLAWFDVTSIQLLALIGRQLATNNVDFEAISLYLLFF